MKIKKEQIEQVERMIEQGKLTGELRGRVVENLLKSTKNPIDWPGDRHVIDMTTGKRDFSLATDGDIEWLIKHVETTK